MKKFKAILLSLLLIVNVFAFSACGKKKDPKQEITSVSAENLNAFYYVTDNPNLENVKIKLTYKDKTTKTLSKGEIDLADDAEPKSETEFVLYTDGLYAQTKAEGNLTKGTYEFKVLVIEDGKTYELDDVVVSEDASDIYDLTLYNQPENFAKFETKSTEEGTEEANFKVHNDTVLTVGNANPFSIKPVFTLTGKEDPSAIVNQDTGSLALDVEVKNGGEALGAETYTFANGKIKFADDAVNNTYTITVVPHDFKDDTTKTFTLTVKVESGYNIEHAYELGLLNMIDNNTGNWYASYDQSLKLFYNNGIADKYEARNYYDVWRPYLEEMFEEDGLDTALIKETNSVFILNDLSVGAQDVPEEYLISAEESAYAAGYSRDWSFLYQHFMTNNFTMNGNYFSISFEKFPVARTNQEYSGSAQVYNGSNAKVEIGHSSAFAFVGEENRVNQYKATIKNLDTYGNANTDNIPEGDDQNALAKGLIFLRAIASSVSMDNLIIKNHVISYFPEAYDKQDNEAQITNTKMYDSFSDAIYNYGATYGGNLINSEIKRCGGPAILLIGVTNLNTSEKYTGLTLAESTVVESFVDTTEPWFSINGATALQGLISQVDNLVKQKTSNQKTIYQEGKLNCICVAIDEGYLTTQKTTLKAKLKYGSNSTLDTEGQILNAGLSNPQTLNNGVQFTETYGYLELLHKNESGVGLMAILLQLF